MGFIFIMILVIFLLHLILPPPNGALNSVKNTLEQRCPLHKWEYVNGRLTCEWCKKTPEQVCLEVL